MDLNVTDDDIQDAITVSLREKGVDLNHSPDTWMPWNSVSLREKGVDLNIPLRGIQPNALQSPFVRREWI